MRGRLDDDPPGRRTPFSEWTYETAVRYLEHALKFGTNPSLAGIGALCDAMGRPQEAMRFVQVTGTNGKSSVTRMTSAILCTHGVRTGAYTSPHLVEYTERMELDGSPVSQAEFARALAAAAEASDVIEHIQSDETGLLEDADDDPDTLAARGRLSLTEFELLTAAALWLFRERGVQWACFEVGMGGRWDATSVVHPSVAVVSGVALDHTDRLGGTIAAIAEDKSHVIKPGSIAVLGPSTADVGDILSRRAIEVGAPIILVAEVSDEGLGAPDGTAANVRFKVHGSPGGFDVSHAFEVRGTRADYGTLEVVGPTYQVSNAAVAIAAAEAALDGPLDADSLREALATIRVRGRFEVVRTSPPLVLDGAHNPEAAAVVADAIEEAFGGSRPVALIGILGDKDAEGIVRALQPHVRGFVCTANSSSRCLPSGELAELVERVTGERPPASDDVAEALRLAEDLAGEAGVVVTGSLYTVGEVEALLGRG